MLTVKFFLLVRDMFVNVLSINSWLFDSTIALINSLGMVQMQGFSSEIRYNIHNKEGLTITQTCYIIYLNYIKTN